MRFLIKSPRRFAKSLYSKLLLYRPVIKVLGVLLNILGGLMFLCLFFSFYFNSPDKLALFTAGTICSVIGLALWLSNYQTVTRVGKREGYLIVSLGWLCMASFGTLPYLFSGVIPDFTNAFFETMSGMTTTGATVLHDIEIVPQGVLFWRSLTQWIGGMGIIVLTVAIFPLLGIGGIELFVAEAPGPTSDKIHPRIRDTAKVLWAIYVSLTGLLTIILFLEGMTFYDAINHALTTMATGGFSTKNASMAFYSPLIQYTIIVFMLLAGTNYTVLYFGLSGKLRKVWNSDEFRFYIFVISLLTFLISLAVWVTLNSSFEKAFRDVLFQIVSLITTTGFVTADYTAWSPALTVFFFILLFSGACAGSTSGGIKLIRHLVFFKNSILEFKRLLHPRALIRIKVDKKVVAPRVLTHILVFLLLYLFLFIGGSILMSIILPNDDQNFLTAIGSVATALGNVGPAIGNVGPTDNFADIPKFGKWVLSVLMLLGRLELYSVLILFSPYFWRAN